MVQVLTSWVTSPNVAISIPATPTDATVSANSVKAIGIYITLGSACPAFIYKGCTQENARCFMTKLVQLGSNEEFSFSVDNGTKWCNTVCAYKAPQTSSQTLPHISSLYNRGSMANIDWHFRVVKQELLETKWTARSLSMFRKWRWWA